MPKMAGDGDVGAISPWMSSPRESVQKKSSEERQSPEDAAFNGE